MATTFFQVQIERINPQFEATLQFYPEQNRVVHAKWSLDGPTEGAKSPNEIERGGGVEISADRTTLYLRPDEGMVPRRELRVQLYIETDLPEWVLLGCQRDSATEVYVLIGNTTLGFNRNGPDDNFQLIGFNPTIQEIGQPKFTEELDQETLRRAAAMMRGGSRGVE